jgi:CHAD domain-containing protein
MRVASRRLRAVLEVFAPCFEKDEFRPVLRDVKRIADALGERRDPDVHIDAMTAFGTAVSAAQRRGVQTFTDRIRERQEAGNRILADALAEMEGSDLAGRLERLADSADPRPREAPAPEEPADDPVAPDASGASEEEEP